MAVVSAVVHIAMRRIKIPILKGVLIRGVIRIKESKMDEIIKNSIYKPNACSSIDTKNLCAKLTLVYI